MTAKLVCIERERLQITGQSYSHTCSVKTPYFGFSFSYVFMIVPVYSSANWKFPED